VSNEAEARIAAKCIVKAGCTRAPRALRLVDEAPCVADHRACHRCSLQRCCTRQQAIVRNQLNAMLAMLVLLVLVLVLPVLLVLLVLPVLPVLPVLLVRPGVPRRALRSK